MLVGNREDERRNAKGYMDITAHDAINKPSHDRDDEFRFRKLLGTIFYICDLAGFKIEGRLTLIDKRTGKTWK